MHATMYRKFHRVSPIKFKLRVRNAFCRFYSEKYDENISSFLTKQDFSARHIGPSVETVNFMLNVLGYKVRMMV